MTQPRKPRSNSGSQRPVPAPPDSGDDTSTEPEATAEQDGAKAEQSPKGTGPGAKSSSAPKSSGAKSSGAKSSDAKTMPTKAPGSKASSTKSGGKPAVAEPPADEVRTPGRTMTAADYARTASGTPDATAVFPRVADTEAGASSAGADPAPPASSTRQARLSLVHVDPWSVTQLTFVISVALMIVAVVAVTVFWLVLNVTGVWGNLNDTVNSVLSSEDGSFDVENYLGFGRVVGMTLVLSAVNVVLMTALAAIGTRLYNAATHIVGGVQVTFRERV